MIRKKVKNGWIIRRWEIKWAVLAEYEAEEAVESRRLLSGA